MLKLYFRQNIILIKVTGIPVFNASTLLKSVIGINLTILSTLINAKLVKDKQPLHVEQIDGLLKLQNYKLEL